jgi:hypothetical protein
LLIDGGRKPAARQFNFFALLVGQSILFLCVVERVVIHVFAGGQADDADQGNGDVGMTIH